MRKIFFLILFAFIFCIPISSQHVLIDETFETSGFNADSLPSGWIQYDVDQSNPTYPFAVWHVRDSGTTFPGVNPILSSQSYQGIRSVSIPWRAGDPIADDWVITDSVTVSTGDS